MYTIADISSAEEVQPKLKKKAKKGKMLGSPVLKKKRFKDKVDIQIVSGNTITNFITS